MSGYASPARSPGLKSPGNLSPRRSGPDAFIRRCDHLCGAVLKAVQADVLNVQQQIEDDKQYPSRATVLATFACMRKPLAAPLTHTLICRGALRRLASCSTTLPCTIW